MPMQSGVVSEYAAHKVFLFLLNQFVNRVSPRALWASPVGVACRFRSEGRGGSQHTVRAATTATGLRRLFLCFCFLEKVCGGPLLLLPGLPLRVLAGSVAAVGSRTPRSWAAPRQGTGTVLAGATGRGTFPPPGGKDHGAQRSGPRPGNEVFALRDKTGTRQCLVSVTGIRLQCVSTPTGHQGRWHNTLSASSATRVWRAEPVIRAGIVEGGFDLEWSFSSDRTGCERSPGPLDSVEG